MGFVVWLVREASTQPAVRSRPRWVELGVEAIPVTKPANWPISAFTNLFVNPLSVARAAFMVNGVTDSARIPPAGVPVASKVVSNVATGLARIHILAQLETRSRVCTLSRTMIDHLRLSTN